MNEKVKKIIRNIGLFCVGIFSAVIGFLGGKLHNKRKRTDTVGEEQSRVGEYSSSLEVGFEATERRIDDIKVGLEDCESTADKLTGIAESNSRILQTIRERKEDNN